MYTDTVSGRNILCVDTIQTALSMGGDSPLIFIHANKYIGELLIIDTNAEVLLLVLCSIISLIISPSLSAMIPKFRFIFPESPDYLLT